MQGNVGEERVRQGQHHPFTLFQGLTKLQGCGGGEVVLVGEEGEQVGCHALLLAAASPLLRNILPQTSDQDKVLVILPAKHRVITNLVNHLYGSREVEEKHELVEAGELAALLGINQELSKVQFFVEAQLPEAEAEVDAEAEEAEQEVNEKSNPNAKEGEAQEWINSECEHCGKSFPNGKKLKQHETRCGAEHKCHLCGDQLASAGNLAVHMRNHIGEKPFACDQCDKTFASLPHMQQHKEFHRPTKDFECDICAKKYQTMNALSQHKADFHSEIKYQCEVCFKLFSAKRYLKEHEKKKHVNSVTIDCDICGKSLAGKHELKIHSRIHTGEKPFHCEECNKDFRARSTFTIHMKSHLGTKNAVCEMCGKRFIQWSDLRKHKRTHTGERPFKCSACGRSFARKDYLTKHERTHKEGGKSLKIVEKVGMTSMAQPGSEVEEEGGLVLEMDMEDMEGIEGMEEMGGEGLQVVELLEGEEGLSVNPESVYYVISG